MSRSHTTADAVCEHLALCEAELREENRQLRTCIATMERERDEALIDREVFRRWMTEWSPVMILTLIALQCDNNVLRRTNSNLGQQQARAEREHQRLRSLVMREADRSPALV